MKEELEAKVRAMVETRVDEAMGKVAREVAKVGLRLEALASSVHQLHQTSNTAIGQQLQADLGYLERVIGCLHACYHDDEVR